MKILLNLITTCLLFYGTAGGAPLGGSVSGSAKQTDLFVVKAGKKLVGATVEVYSSEGSLVTAQYLVKRKLVIDFRAVASGAYTIKVVKGEISHAFHFVKQ
jgi:hypothetical protein